MSESIHFPSASNQSKLSACPTTKVPQGKDWIYQDIYNTMLHSSDYQSFSPRLELFPNNKDSYQVSQTLAEALDIVTNEDFNQSEWVNQYDYRPTSMLETTLTYDRNSLPDLDSTVSEEEEEEEYEEDRVETPFDMSHFDSAPVLIESTLSSCTTSTEIIPYQYNNNNNMMVNTLNKRRSTASFGSFKSFINAFSPSKKFKLNSSSHSKKKFFQFFKR